MNYLTIVAGVGIAMSLYFIAIGRAAIKAPPPPDVHERRFRSYQKSTLYLFYFSLTFCTVFFVWTLTFPATFARQP